MPIIMPPPDAAADTIGQVRERPRGAILTSTEAVAAAVLACAAVILLMIHGQMTYSEPGKTAGAYLTCVSKADLDGMKASSLDAQHASFVSHFGEQKYDRVRYIFSVVYQAGLRRCQEYLDKAEAGGNAKYNELQQQVADAGRQAFLNLSVDERISMMNDRAQLDRFVYDQGLAALPAADRAMIANAEDFRYGRDRYSFIRKNAWTFLSDEDRRMLGSPNVLAEKDNPEKLAFIDRVGIPLLSERSRSEIAGMQRSDLENREAFQLKFGEPGAKQFLADAKFSGQGKILCTYEMQERGSLFHGNRATCATGISGRNANQALTIVLEKVQYDWRVSRMEPALYDIGYDKEGGE